MPNRLLRDGILTSTKVCSLGFPEEVFYRRLMSIVDDYGRHEASLPILRAKLYPLQVDTVRVADITRWMAACQKAGVIALYAYPSPAASPRWISADETAGLSVYDGKPYLEMVNFGQQIRAKSKCPPPPGYTSEQSESPENVGNHLLASDINCKQMLAGAISPPAENDATAVKSMTKGNMLASANNCEQMLSTAHLDGDVGGDVILPTYLPTSQARAREGAFPISASWEPSPDFWTLAKRSSHTPENPDYADALTDFIAYWLTNPGETRTQAQWEKSFLESWKRYRAHSAPADKTGRKRTAALSPHNDFEQRDYSAGINADGSF